MFCATMKLKRCFVIGACIAIIFFTLLLVADMQMNANLSSGYLAPFRGRVKFVNTEDDPESVYYGFNKRLLGRTHSATYNASKETNPGDTAAANQNLKKTVKASKKAKRKEVEPHDDFDDLVDYIMLDSLEREKHRMEVARVHPVILNVPEDESDNPTIAEIKHIKARDSDAMDESMRRQYQDGIVAWQWHARVWNMAEHSWIFT